MASTIFSVALIFWIVISNVDSGKKNIRTTGVRRYVKVNSQCVPYRRAAPEYQNGPIYYNRQCFGRQRPGLGITKKYRSTNKQQNKHIKDDETSKKTVNRGNRNGEKTRSPTGVRPRRDAQLGKGAGIANVKQGSGMRGGFSKRNHVTSRQGPAGSRNDPVAPKTASTSNEAMLSDQAPVVRIQSKRKNDRNFNKDKLRKGKKWKKPKNMTLSVSERSVVSENFVVLDSSTNAVRLDGLLMSNGTLSSKSEAVKTGKPEKKRNEKRKKSAQKSEKGSSTTAPLIKSKIPTTPKTSSANTSPLENEMLSDQAAPVAGQSGKSRRRKNTDSGSADVDPIYVVVQSVTYKNLCGVFTHGGEFVKSISCRMIHKLGYKSLMETTSQIGSACQLTISPKNGYDGRKESNYPCDYSWKRDVSEQNFLHLFY